MVLMKFWGGSFVANAQGKLLYSRFSRPRRSSLLNLDLSQTDYFRKHWRNFLETEK